MILNEEQTAAVEHPVGAPAVLIAGAGSGKTRVLTERVKWLMESQLVSPARILCLTFTNKAAGEMMARLNIPEDEHTKDTPYVTTIHSIALSYIRRAPGGFGLRGKVSPLDDYNQEQMLKQLIDRKLNSANADSYAAINQWLLKEKIQFHRARGLGFQVEYTPEYNKLAEERHGGYHAMNEAELDIWYLYELEKKANCVVDFDDMLHLCVRRGRNDEDWLELLQNRFHHVLMDEAQDTNPVQWEFVNMHLGPANKNFYVVGDMSQCQPPGTMVKIKVADHKPHGKGKPWTPSQWIEKDIASLTKGELAKSWSKRNQRTSDIGRKIEVASRQYKGTLWRIRTGEHHITRVTPNHYLWVKFNEEAKGKYAVYLMWHSRLGFRVGITKLRYSQSHRAAYGLTSRMRQEKADKGWILQVVDTKTEALGLEDLYSLQYGIPQTRFEADDPQRLTVFHYAKMYKGNAGFECLEANNLLWEEPLAERRIEFPTLYTANWRGYFMTAAANAQILAHAHVIDLPAEGTNKSTLVVAMTPEKYEGLVYSLDVDADHTYVADGIVVGNSIYGFNGAMPRLLKEYSEGWRGLVPALYRIKRNHRSVPEVVALANAIQRKMTETIPLQMESWRGVNGEHGRTKMIQAMLPSDIAEIMAREIYLGANREEPRIPYRDNAILVRSGTQIRDIEGELVKLRIPYIVRGGRGLLGTEEVRDVLAFMRLATNPNDYQAFCRAVSIPRRGVGKVMMDKLRQVAEVACNGDLIEACKTMPEKLDGFVTAMREIQRNIADAPRALVSVFDAIGYITYIKEKYGADPTKIRMKVENLGRLQMLVKGLTETGCVTTEDVVFRLTMEKAADDDQQGQVIISTIHAAKGLEWHRVYVASVVEGYLPHKWSRTPEEVEEERRLWYVAITRAKDKLVVCVPGMIQYPNSEPKKCQPSRFLFEVGIMK